MSGNAKFRWFLLVPIVLALLVVNSPVISWAGELEDAQKAVRAMPHNSYEHYNLGFAYYNLAKYEEAIASFKETIRIKPDDAMAHYYMGITYQKLYRHMDAISHFKELIRINPNYSNIHYNLGFSYNELGEYRNAIASYKEAIRIEPDDAYLHRLLGFAYNETGQYQEAITSYKRALRIDPKHTTTRSNLNSLRQKIAQVTPPPPVKQPTLQSEKGSGELEYAKERVRQNPNDAEAHAHLGYIYGNLRDQDAIASYKEAIRIQPDFADAHHNLGFHYRELGQYKEAIASYKEAIRIEPDYVGVHNNLGNIYYHLEQYQKAIASYKEAPDDAMALIGLGSTYGYLGENQKAISSFRESIRIEPNSSDAHNGLGYGSEKLGYNDVAIAEYKEALRIDPANTKARINLNNLEQKIAQAKPAPPVRQAIPQPPAKQRPQAGTGSGFFVSKMGHVITNAHVVQNCKKITIGDNANKQVPAELINTDRSNDLALLKLSTLEMASAESQSLIQKLSIVVVPIASKGLLRDTDVRLGEKVLVAGYPFGEFFSNTIKVTSGIVSATRGAGDDSGQFQLDAAVQPGNSGGPIYDSGGNIVGVVISQLDKLKVAKAIGSIPENVNFGIKASTVRQFLISSGLPSKKSERTEEKSTEQLAEIAKNQALMIMCLQ